MEALGATAAAEEEEPPSAAGVSVSFSLLPRRRGDDCGLQVRPLPCSPRPPGYPRRTGVSPPLLPAPLHWLCSPAPGLMGLIQGRSPCLQPRLLLVCACRRLLVHAARPLRQPPHPWWQRLPLTPWWPLGPSLPSGMLLLPWLLLRLQPSLRLLPWPPPFPPLGRPAPPGPQTLHRTDRPILWIAGGGIPRECPPWLIRCRWAGCLPSRWLGRFLLRRPATGPYLLATNRTVSPVRM
jgi:hypothetical protein